MKLSISYLSIKENMLENMNKINDTSADYVHVDVMDGLFVSNKTKNIEEITKYLKVVNKPFDVHLMVKDIKKYVDEYERLNPKYITFHLEATNDISNMIKYIKDKGIKVGLSIKPNTDIDLLKPYLNSIDLVLVMSVEPGMGGQDFIDKSEDRINQLYKIKEENNYSYIIEVDGGINPNTVKKCIKSDIVVVGSFITSSNNYQDQIEKLRL